MLLPPLSQKSSIDFCVSNSPNRGSSDSFKADIYFEGKSRMLVQTLVGKANSYPIPAQGYKTGFHWPPVKWDSGIPFKIPSDWNSGRYSVELTNADNEVNKGLIDFIVKSSEPGSKSKIIFMWPVTTYQAYNGDGGKSLYEINQPWRSRVVSFNRTRNNNFHGEEEFVKWLEEKGIPVEHCTSIDIHNNDGNFIGNYQLLLSVGHDEYWSKEMRDNVEDFIHSGGNVAFFSGNTCWWQIRLEDDCQTMICYKNAIDDPLTGIDDERVTESWSSAPVNRPENSLTGVSYRSGGWSDRFASATYQLKKSDHWVFNGTGLENNDSFAKGYVGFEVDSALYDVTDKILRVTGKDGTPDNFTILAVSDVTDWRYDGQGGKATMGIYTNGGTVFTAASMDWCKGLFSDSDIDKVTKNVLDELKKPLTGDYCKLGIFKSPGYSWEKIDKAKNIVAMTGYVERHLFAATSDNQLLRRDPIGELAKWENIGDAKNIRALSAPFIKFGKIIAATSDNKLIVRNAVSSAASWETLLDGMYNIRAMASNFEKLFIANDEGELWIVDVNSKVEELIGRCTDIIAMTLLGGKLYAINNDTRLLCREPVEVDISWTEIGDAPKNVISLAGYYGRLFAVTSDGDLWWRAAVCIPSPLFTGSLLFYNSKEGKASTGPFDGNGDFRTEQYYPDELKSHEGFSKDWSHVASTKIKVILFYDSKTGKGATGIINDKGIFTTLQLFPDPTKGNPGFSQNWTHITSARNGLLLFYNESDGSACSVGLTVLGKVRIIETYLEGAFSPSWTHIVNC